MHYFGSSNQLWTELKTFLAAMASAACYTTGEKAQLSAIHARLAAASTTMYGHEASYLAAKFKRLLWAWEGSND